MSFAPLPGFRKNTRTIPIWPAGLPQRLWPLKDTGQLAGSPGAISSGVRVYAGNFERLCLLRDSLEGIPLIAEFGCPDWLSPRAAKHLATAHIALACVDGGTSLKEKTFFCATTGLAYVRFQGRNQSRWVKGDGSAQHDYLYSRAELASVIPGNPPPGTGM